MKNKKCLLLISIYITFTLFSGSSISAVGRGEPNSDQREGFCTASFFQCKALAESSCNAEVGTGNPIGLSDCIGSRTNTCDLRFGVESSSCMTDPKLASGFDKSFVPRSGFVAAPPVNNGSSRTPAKPAAPMNNLLVAPLVVPKKKTNSRQTISQPQMKTMSAPTIQPKQRVKSPTNRKVVTPSSSTVPENKRTIKQAVPVTSEDVKKKSNQPVIRKMNNRKTITAPPASSNFDEADAIFGKRSEVKNTLSR